MVVAQDGCTALIVASYNGHTATVQVLLKDVRVDVNLRDGDGRTALVWSCSKGHVTTTQALISDKRVAINLRTKVSAHAHHTEVHMLS